MRECNKYGHAGFVTGCVLAEVKGMETHCISCHWAVPEVHCGMVDKQ